MNAFAPGLNIKLIDDNYLCTFSVTQELNLIVGDILLIGKWCEIFMGKNGVEGPFGALPQRLRSKLECYLMRVVVLDRFYSRRVREAVSIKRCESNIRELRPVNVEFEASPRFTLAETRRPFETRADVYAYIAGMCGVGMHSTGELHLMDLAASRKALNDWWEQIFVAQDLCARMYDFVSVRTATISSSTQLFEELLATDRALSRIVNEYKSRRLLSN